MTPSLRPRLLALLVVLLVPVVGRAQVPGAEAEAVAPRLQEGIEAYREGRFEDARRVFEAAVEADPDNAEAHFLLARVYFDTPLRDEGRAGRHLARARALDPENLRYMVAELQQLRTDTLNFLQEMLRQRERLALARDILERDPANGFAHEEFGVYYVRDYYHYRNAIAFPGLGFASRGRLGSDNVGTEYDGLDFNEVAINPQTGQPIDDAQQSIADANTLAWLRDFTELTGPGALGTNDRFDLEVLRGQGAAALDLRRRADEAYTRAAFHLA